MSFNFKENLQKKMIGYYLGLVSAVLGLIALIIFQVYATKNKAGSAWVVVALILAVVIELAMFFLNEKISDIAAIVPPVLYMVGLGEELHTGVGNIVDALQGIVMFGNSSLASTNYLLAVLLGIACVIAIVACFLPKEKELIKA